GAGGWRTAPPRAASPSRAARCDRRAAVAPGHSTWKVASSPPAAAARRQPKFWYRIAPVRVKRAAEVLLTSGLFAHALFCPISIAATQIGLGIAAAGLICAAIAGWRPRRSPLDVPLFALVAISILSDVLSPYGPPGLGFATLWRSALGFWVVYQGLSFEPRAAGRLVLFSAAGLALSSFVGLVQFRTGIDLVHWLGLREQPAWVEAPGAAGRYGAMGFFTSRLTFGHNASVLLALLASAVATGEVPRRLRWPAIGAAALGFAAILATF